MHRTGVGVRERPGLDPTSQDRFEMSSILEIEPSGRMGWEREASKAPNTLKNFPNMVRYYRLVHRTRGTVDGWDPVNCMAVVVDRECCSAGRLKSEPPVSSWKSFEDGKLLLDSGLRSFLKYFWKIWEFTKLCRDVLIDGWGTLDSVITWRYIVHWLFNNRDKPDLTSGLRDTRHVQTRDTFKHVTRSNTWHVQTRDTFLIYQDWHSEHGYPIRGSNFSRFILEKNRQ